jgi:prophage regulatory protein
MSQQASRDRQSGFDSLPNSAFIRLSQLVGSGVVPFSPSTTWRKVRAGRFPAPVKVSSAITAWRVGDIKAWLQDPGSYCLTADEGGQQ